MKQWNQIFKKHGKVFLKPQEDTPRIAKLFKRKDIRCEKYSFDDKKS